MVRAVEQPANRLGKRIADRLSAIRTLKAIEEQHLGEELKTALTPQDYDSARRTTFNGVP